ncbi:RESTRICTED TEV MOVEMENT 2 [Spatholobus suberectus]|nr:RESTRICTED TEV MOVEMENT 2 [Spatholobus suberectus]
MEMSTLQPNLNYDNWQPKLGTKETPESHILLVHLPGYAQEDIGAKFEYDYRRVRVFGGRPLGDNRSIRFNIVYAVPWNCDVNKLKGMFQGEIYSVIMPKVTTSSEVLDQNSPKSSSHSTEPKPEKSLGVIPPKSEKGQVEISEEPKSIIESQKQANETLTAPKATSDSVTQKGEEGISQDAKNQTEEKVLNGEKKRVDEKETKEESKNASASGKPPQKGKKEHVMDETSFTPKSAENGKGKGKENVEMNGKLSDAEIIGSSKRKRIKEVAASASHAVTSLVKRFNEENMMPLYTSATVLVLALGVYASCKLRSSARQ